MTYAANAKTALRLLKKFGQAVTLTTRTAGAYDTATGAAAIVETTQACIGAVFDYGKKDIDGTLIQDGDKQLLLSALLASGAAISPPILDDAVTVDGIVYIIKGLKVLSPGGVVVMFDLNIRA